LLSGCFTANTEKLPLATAVPAFGEGGRYDVYERGDGDAYQRQNGFVMTHRSDGGYDFTGADGKVLTVSLHRLRENDFILQAREEPGAFMYGIFRVRPDAAYFHLPQCDGQDKEKLAAFGVEVLDRFECSIARVADVLALFATLQIGPPISKIVRVTP